MALCALQVDARVFINNMNKLLYPQSNVIISV